LVIICIIPCPRDIINQSERKSINYTHSDNIDDFRQQPLPLFKHNNEIYYGHRSTVYKSILCLNEILDCADFADLIVLEGELPYYLINMYIKSCYSNIFDIKKVNPDDIKKFIRFIDQYPTTIISINNFELEFIDFFEKNNIKYDDFLINMCKKYELRCMYLDIHNKNINISDNLNNESDESDNIFLLTESNQYSGLIRDHEINSLIGSTGPDKSTDYNFSCPVVQYQCLVCCDKNRDRYEKLIF